MIYFDYAATTPVRDGILTAYDYLLRNHYANSASLHILGARVDSLQNRSREQIAELLKVRPNEIIFTSGASEANNIAIKGVAFKYANRGKHIITTEVEHPSVLEACKQLVNLFGYEVTYLPVNEDGVVTVDDLKKAMRKDTILVSIMHVNNETGSINDIESIGEYLKKEYPNVFFHVDATQSVGKVEVKTKNIDLLSLSAHKLYGLKGSGMLLKKDRVQLVPLISGGSQEFGLRAGTSNWAVNILLAKTMRLAYENQDAYYKIVKGYNDRVRDAIKELDGVLINSPIDASPYILNLSFIGKKASIVSVYFEKEGICISSVSACGSKDDTASYVIEAMYKDNERAKSSVRICFSHLTTQEEVEYLIEVIRKATKAIL